MSGVGESGPFGENLDEVVVQETGVLEGEENLFRRPA